MRYPRRAVHLDFHTMPKVPDVGLDFNARRFAETLKAAHVESVNVLRAATWGLRTIRPRSASSIRG